MTKENWVPHIVKYVYLGTGEHYEENITVMIPKEFRDELIAIKEQHNDNP